MYCEQMLGAKTKKTIQASEGVVGNAELERERDERRSNDQNILLTNARSFRRRSLRFGVGSRCEW
jgi:hypothetical protein